MIFDDLYNDDVCNRDRRKTEKKERSVGTGMWGFVSQTIQKW